MLNFWQSILTSSIALIVLILLIFIVYTITNSRGMKKRKEHFAHLHNSLKEGQKIMFGNGIYGTIVDVREDIVDVKVKSGTVMEISRYSISEII